MELHIPVVLVSSTLVCTFGFFYIAAILKQTFLKDVKRSSVLEVSNKIISALHGFVSASAGVVIALKTRDDVIHSKHPWTNPIMLISTGYELYDLWAMYYVYRSKLEDNNEEIRWTTILWFIRARWPIVVHHAFFILLLFPATMWWRTARGDFFVGSFYILDASTPFVSLRAILAELGATDRYIYTVNAILMIIVFFICRLCIFPFMFYAYAQQAGISTFLVPFYIPKKCVFFCSSLLALQIYWFLLMLKGAKKVISKKNV